MRPSLRQRLLIVALLGAVSCAISLIGLMRVVSLSSDQRRDRARDTVLQQLAVLRRAYTPGKTAASEPAIFVGMRGGYVISAAAFRDPPPQLDTPDRQAVERAIAAAERSRDTVQVDMQVGGDTHFVAASPVDGGAFAWVSYGLHPPPFVSFWRLIGGSLTIATLLLLGTAGSAVVSVERGAASLKASLARLTDDLGAPIPRPPVRELRDVADGIAGMARALAGAQEEKERLGAELARQDRLAALGRVAAGVAHEVRNPLASIKLRVDLGRQRAGVPPQLARELESVSEEVTRLDRLVADLLVVAGRRCGPRASTALGPLVRRRVCLLAPWADERGVKISVSGDATCPLDVDAVSRAVDNLIRNAVEASPRASMVEIEVSDGPGAAHVTVLDHGEGVDPARLPELFEPFFTTKPDGMGLGLALSRAIAMAHEGNLTYARRDHATCFELSFPATEARS